MVYIQMRRQNLQETVSGADYADMVSVAVICKGRDYTLMGTLRSVPDLIQISKSTTGKRKHPPRSLDSSAASSESSALEVFSQSTRCKIRRPRGGAKNDRLLTRSCSNDRAQDRTSQSEYRSPSWPSHDREQEEQVQTTAVKAVPTASETPEPRLATNEREHDGQQHYLEAPLANHVNDVAVDRMSAPLKTVQRLLRDVTRDSLSVRTAQNLHLEASENQNAMQHENGEAHDEGEVAPFYGAVELGIASEDTRHHQPDDYTVDGPVISFDEQYHRPQMDPQEHHGHYNDAEISGDSSDGMSMDVEVENPPELQSPNILDIFGTAADDVHRRLWRRRQR